MLHTPGDSGDLCPLRGGWAVVLNLERQGRMIEE